MLKNKKNLPFILLAGTSYILSLSGTTLAQPVVPSGPLPPNDPAAQLDPALRNVKPETVPNNARSQNRTNSNASSVIGYNVQTRQTQVSASSPTRTSAIPFRGSAPNPGSSSNIKTEPSAGLQSQVGGPKPNSVIGTDNRTKITDTTSYPWSAITKLYTTYPNGDVRVCSGTLIAAKYVLTAGHCVHNPARGGWAKKVEVIPGLRGTYKPFSSAFSTYIRSYTGWTVNRDSNHDFALITLDRPIGNTTGWLGYAYYSTVNGLTGHIAGYPADRDNGLYLYYHYGSIASSNSYRLFYQIDTEGGQSGSGIYYKNAHNQRYVFGVHAYGVDSSSPNHNSGTRLNSQKFDDIAAWIKSGT